MHILKQQVFNILVHPIKLQMIMVLTKVIKIHMMFHNRSFKLVEIMEIGVAEGYFGIAGFDLLLDKHGEVFAIDLNFRQMAQRVCYY